MSIQYILLYFVSTVTVLCTEHLAQLQTGLVGILYFVSEILHHLKERLALLLGLNPPDELSCQVNPALRQVVHCGQVSGEY